MFVTINESEYIRGLLELAYSWLKYDNDIASFYVRGIREFRQKFHFYNCV